jgi:diguanylate cyclase (GGDEF)-like protein
MRMEWYCLGTARSYMISENSINDRALARQAEFNRFRERFVQLLNAAAKTEEAVSLVIVDVDMFGLVNRKHGDATGDAVLFDLAAFLAEAFSGGEVLRCGGDAFAVVLPGVEKEQAFIRAEQARESYGGTRKVESGGKDIALDLAISEGVAAFPDDGADAVLLFRKANEALYRAKVSGRNKVCLAREEKMMTKTVHYTQGQLHGLSRLAKRGKVGEAALLREALDDLLRKHNA